MPLPRTLTLAALAASAASAHAAIVPLADYTKTADGDETFASLYNNDGTLGQTDPLSVNYTAGDVYVVMTVTFSNPANPGTLDTSEAFGGYSHSGSDNFGQNWQQSTVGVNYYGGRNDIAGVTITPGTPITLVAKYVLNNAGLDGDTIQFWVNPALGTGTEPTPDDADPARVWNPAAIGASDMRFRRGVANNDNHMAYTNIAIYSDGDSPFVPEPASAALVGLGGLLIAGRRRRA